jgi:hypothetical protein
VIALDARARPGRPPGPRPPVVITGALVAAPIAAAAVVMALAGLSPLALSITAFFALALGLLFLPPRGLSVSRTWVVGYLTLQFPLRAFFLLSDQPEPPPIFRAYTPGAGLEQMLTTAMIQVDVALAVLGAAYAVAALRMPRRPVVVDAGIDRRRFGLLFALALVLLVVELRAAGGEVAGGGDFITAMPGLAAAGASAAVCYAFARRPAQHLVIFALALAYNATRVALLGSKLSLLASGLALIIGYSTRARSTADPSDGRRMARSLRTGLTSVALVLVATYAFAAAVPTGQRGDVGASVGQGAANALSRSYGVDALLAVDGYLDGGGHLQMGDSLAGFAWSWVPRTFWPDKPKSFSVTFGEEVFSFSSIAGESFFAPGYFGEWVINWGAIGLLVGAVLYGVALAWVDRVPALARRLLWIIIMVHLVEGSLVAQFWLAAPFLVGGYAVLARTMKSDPASDQEAISGRSG